MPNFVLYESVRKIIRVFVSAFVNVAGYCSYFVSGVLSCACVSVLVVLNYFLLQNCSNVFNFFLFFLQMPRKCVDEVDSFCYICRKITFALRKRNMTALIRKAYHLYFGCKIGDQDKSWARPICCNICATNFRQWLSRNRKCIPFAVPMVWREPIDLNSNCYFCFNPPIGESLSRKKKQNIQYPDIPSAIRPVWHGETLPVPEAPREFTFDSDDEQSVSSSNSDGLSMSQELYFASSISHKPHLITQSEL